MINLELVFPEIFLSLSIMFLLILGVFKRNSSKLIQNISLIVLLVTSVIIVNETLGVEETFLFNGSVIIDYLSSLMKIITLLAAFFVLIISSNYLKSLNSDKYFAEMRPFRCPIIHQKEREQTLCMLAVPLTITMA